MVLFHFLYDLTELYGLVDWKIPGWAQVISGVGGKIFLLLSGVCVILGHHPVRRGITVLLCGMGISFVTVGLWAAGFGNDILICFGVLHCLGCCMLLWPLFRRLPGWGIGLSGLLSVGLGLYFETLTGQSFLLMPLGITPAGFAAADYFPLMPNLGFFLWGALLGRTLYREKESLFPRVDSGRFPLSVLQWIGTRSLPIYLLHQPVLTAFCWLLGAF